jgi:hypothetical protein
VRELGWEFLDAELGADELSGISGHAAGCGTCRTALAFDRAFLELLARQRALTAPVLVVWQVKVSLRSART